VPSPLPFDDSRRLTGPNLFFASPGAVLELVGVAADSALVEDWTARVDRARSRLGWSTDAGIAARWHGSGVTLALAAPFDQLFTATEVNEWALCSALQARDAGRWSGLREALAAAALEESHGPADAGPPELDEAAALARLARLAAAESRAPLRELTEAAVAHGLSWLVDDDEILIGTGAGSRRYALEALPASAEVPWPELHDVPTALVTGSNGKTTTVRLIAACNRAQGRRPGYSCTDGLFVDGEWIERGDYSGPVGARTVLRDRRVEAAVLETARGGILRRGLAVARADVAVVTNVSADHFGEYGIHDLDSLADVKLTVGAVVPHRGLLVLNADDPALRAKAPGLAGRFGHGTPLGWFSRDADEAQLVQHREAGGATCGVRAGRLAMARDGIEHDLGPVAGMPISMGGSAAYNVANLAAAALAAAAMGVAPETVASVFARFGTDPRDNPGRLMRFETGGVQVIVDYAHNAEGLRGLLEVAVGLRADGGRLGLILGHAGNREDADIERLAEVAAEFEPALVVLKELQGYLRGRAPGEVPRILRDALLRAGLPAAALPERPDEVAAARLALDWARPGDVLVLPVHGLAARAEVVGSIGRS
jgi:UDP-N-acetylmuramyl tripeptide synthase